MHIGHEALLGCIAQRFPAATEIEFHYNPYSSYDRDHLRQHVNRLAACMAVLPDGCWQTIRDYRARFEQLAPLAAHVGRLCPRLRSLAITCGEAEGAALMAALRGLAAAAGTLRSLTLSVYLTCLEPGDAPRIAAALDKLTGLRGLGVSWDARWPDDSAGLLAGALPSLTSLTSLEASCRTGDPRDPPQLGTRLEALRELSLLGDQRSPWALGALHTAPQLPAITKMTLQG